MPVFENVPIVGMHFRGAEVKQLVSTFVAPITLTLEPEPSNQYDSNAIKVFYEDTHIGYIKADSAAYIAPYLADDEYVAVFERLVEAKNNLYPLCTVAPIGSFE